MQSELLIAVLAGLGGMLGWGLADFFAKKTIDKIGDILTLAWGHIFGTITLILFYFFVVSKRNFAFPSIEGLNTWLILAGFGVLQAVVYFFVYRGFGKGQVTLLAPVFASFSGITAILSILVFNEVVNAPTLLLLFATFFGIFMISFDFSSFRSKKINFLKIHGLKEIALATAMAALWTLFWDKFLGGKDWLVYTILMYFFMTVTIIMYVWLRKISLLKIPPNSWKFLIFIGLGETLAYLAISIGYSTTNFTSVIALLSGAFSLPTIILAYIFLKERVTRSQFVGCLLIVCCIALFSVV